MQNNKILVSIIVPFHNTELYIEKCISSIINQSYKNIEVILINDNSTDNSKKLIKKYILADMRIKYYEINAKNISYARNFGVSKVKGLFTLFVDSDDYVSKNYVLELLKCFINYKCDLVLCNYYTCQSNFHPIKKIRNIPVNNVVMNKYDYWKNYFNPMCENMNFALNNLWNKMYKTSLLKNIHFNGSIAEDISFMYRYIDSCKKIVFLDKPLYFYLSNRVTSLSHNRTLEDKATEVVNTNYQKYLFFKKNKYPKQIILNFGISFIYAYCEARKYKRNFKTFVKSINCLHYLILNNGLSKKIFGCFVLLFFKHIYKLYLYMKDKSS